ncbi:MAG: 2-C-methyl-D-erythritol 4-phosphate cytidylyltransferase [Bacteroidota bacterium]
MNVGGKPLLMHTLMAFSRFDIHLEIILVLPDDQIKNWGQICRKYHFNVRHQVIAGGPERFHSVKSGLKLVEKESLVAVHDGVRPLLTLDLIKRTFEAAAKYGAAIPCIEVKESLREINGASSVPVDRHTMRLVQTPQCFKSGLLTDAYNISFQPKFTDDATVVENAGHKIFIVEGDPLNIKITLPMDLIIAESLISKS